MLPIAELPPSLAPILTTLEGSLERVEARISQQLKSDLPPVDALVDHVKRYRGKMLRPSLVVLCGQATGHGAAVTAGDVSEDHVTVGAVCELVHLATLVHDDVLDEADVRRRTRTVNRLAGNEAAVILGDYLIAAAFHLCSSLDDQSTALAVGAASMTLCSGELLQLHHRRDYSIDEPTYFEIIERKTASLIALSCRLGARHAGADAALQARFESYGRSLGLAFQIQDDLLDLTGKEQAVGKSVGLDLGKGKLTLPLVHHLENVDPDARARALALIDAAGSGDPIAGALLAQLVSSSGSVDYARSIAGSLVRDAREAIGALPPSPARDLLDTMASAVITRGS